MISTERHNIILELFDRLNCSTIASLFLERYSATPSEVAFRYKDRGIYKEVTWRQYHTTVKNLCLGLVELGLEPGDLVAVMGDNCIEWVYADMATQCAGAISYGIYPTSSIPEVEYLLKNGQAKFFIAEDQEYVDKVLSIADKLPQLHKIIVADTRGTFMYQDARLLNFEQLMELGKKRDEKEPYLFEKLVGEVEPEDAACLIYTSGTTGQAKGAVFTHRGLLMCLGCWIESCSELLLGKQNTAVSTMPYAHLFGKVTLLYSNLILNLIIHFPEETETLPETLYEIQPTLFTGAPRMLQKYAAQALTGITTSHTIEKACYELAMKIGRSHIREKWEGKKSIYFKVLYWFAYQLAFRGIMDRLGFRKTRMAMIGGAPVPPAVSILWEVWGVSVTEVYGATENGYISLQRGPFPRPGNAGNPFFGVEVRIAHSGEMLTRSSTKFNKYWQNDEETAKVVENGWVHSGDIAELTDDGQIRIVDREKDILVTAGGKNISPAEIEKYLKASPYISEAIVLGDAKKYPVALVEINFDTVAEWARAKNIVYTSFANLTQQQEVCNLIENEIKKCNERLARVEQVKKFKIIPKELDPEDEADPLTATRKVQRKKMYAKFKDMVDSMYAGELAEEEAISAEVLGKGGEKG